MFVKVEYMNLEFRTVLFLLPILSTVIIHDNMEEMVTVHSLQSNNLIIDFHMSVPSECHVCHFVLRRLKRYCHVKITDHSEGNFDGNNSSILMWVRNPFVMMSEQRKRILSKTIMYFDKSSPV